MPHQSLQCFSAHPTIGLHRRKTSNSLIVGATSIFSTSFSLTPDRMFLPQSIQMRSFATSWKILGHRHANNLFVKMMLTSGELLRSSDNCAFKLCFTKGFHSECCKLSAISDSSVRTKMVPLDAAKEDTTRSFKSFSATTVQCSSFLITVVRPLVSVT